MTTVQAVDLGNGKFYARYKLSGQWFWRCVERAHYSDYFKVEYDSADEALAAAWKEVDAIELGKAQRIRYGLVVRQETR